MNREEQTIEGFFRYNQARPVQDFATYATICPRTTTCSTRTTAGTTPTGTRANTGPRPRVDLRLPQDGTGGSEWRGLLPIQRVPHAVNFKRGWLVNWNNQPALGWKRERAYTLIDNAQDLENALDPGGAALNDPFGGLNPDVQVDYDDLVANLRYGAFKHHRDLFRRFVPAAGPEDGPGEEGRRTRAVLGRVPDRSGRRTGCITPARPSWTAGSAHADAAFDDDLGDLADNASESLLWHLLSGRDRLKQRFDWLGSDSPKDWPRRRSSRPWRLAEEFGNGGSGHLAAVPCRGSTTSASTQTCSRTRSWGRSASTTPTTSARPATCRTSSRWTGGPTTTSSFISTARGGPLGRSASKAGSVIPPGQSGFIDLLGQEAPHSDDRFALYLEWRFKPMPTTLAEALAVQESEIVLVRPD